MAQTERDLPGFPGPGLARLASQRMGGQAPEEVGESHDTRSGETDGWKSRWKSRWKTWNTLW